MIRTIPKILLACICVGIVWQAVSQSPQETGADDRPPIKALPQLPPNGQFHGMAIQLHVDGTSAYEQYHRLIPEIAALGANTVLFVVHGWQEHAGTLDLHIDARKTPEAKDLGRLIDHATANGLQVILMPIVLLEHPRNNEWRGRIIPEGQDWDNWFKRYTSFIVQFAHIAERHHVAVLMVGSELIKTETYTNRWKRVIQEVRQNYRGKLGYSSNWDHYQTTKIGFWPLLDYVGMTTYYDLAKAANPEMKEIDENWAKIKTDIQAFQREVNKPIIFTEVGWCSQEGSAHEGWNYYANQKATAKGHEEQLRLYKSFLKTWADAPGIGGIIWWEWDTTEGGKDDYNYTPRGKPAETLLREWFKSRKQSIPIGQGGPASNGL